MAWADFFLSRIGLLAAAGVLLVAALALPSALAPRAEEAAAARAADGLVQRAAALAAALPGAEERFGSDEGVEIEVGPDRVAARAGAYRVVRPFLQPVHGPTSLGADGAALEATVSGQCGADAGCAARLLQEARAEFRESPIRPVGRTLVLQRLGPRAQGAVFVSEPGGVLLRLRGELRSDAEGGLLQRVEALHLGGPPLDVRGAVLKLWAAGKPLAPVPLPGSVGIPGTRGVGGVFHSNNTSGPLWEPGESGWVNVARSQAALLPGDPLRAEVWNGTGLLARAQGTVA